MNDATKLLFTFTYMTFMLAFLTWGVNQNNKAKENYSITIQEEPVMTNSDCIKLRRAIVLDEFPENPEWFDEFIDEYDKAEEKEVQLALNPPKPKPKKKKAPAAPATYPQGNGCLTRAKGVNYYNGVKETYYNLPMGGVVSIAKSMGIQGEYWVRADGVKMYGDYVMVAANLSQFPRGSIVSTSLGTGIVLDTGGMGYNWFDIAVNW